MRLCPRRGLTWPGGKARGRDRLPTRARISATNGIGPGARHADAAKQSL